MNRTVSILLFDEVEPLDFVGPLEVFVAAGRRANLNPFQVLTVSEHGGQVTARGGLRIVANHAFSDAPVADILVIPGGLGTRREMRNGAVLDWVRAHAERAEAVLSVCTGSLVLGAAGLLDGLRTTTHFAAMDVLGEVAPRAVRCPGSRYLDNGKFIVAAGVSAGIDAALFVVGRMLGPELAAECAAYIEYDWREREPD